MFGLTYIIKRTYNNNVLPNVCIRYLKIFFKLPVLEILYHEMYTNVSDTKNNQVICFKQGMTKWVGLHNKM